MEESITAIILEILIGALGVLNREGLTLGAIFFPKKYDQLLERVGVENPLYPGCKGPNNSRQKHSLFAEHHISCVNGDVRYFVSMLAGSLLCLPKTYLVCHLESKSSALNV